jgi:hypothetical protein
MLAFLLQQLANVRKAWALGIVKSDPSMVTCSPKIACEVVESEPGRGRISFLATLGSLSFSRTVLMPLTSPLIVYPT